MAIKQKPTKVIVIRLPPGEYWLVKREAKRQKTSMTGLVRAAIRRMKP